MFCEVYLDLILFHNENRYLTFPQKKVTLFLVNLTFQAPPPTPPSPPPPHPTPKKYKVWKPIFTAINLLELKPFWTIKTIFNLPSPPLLNFLENFNSPSFKRGVGRGTPHYVFGIISWRYAQIQRDASEMASDNADDFNSQLKTEKKRRTKKKNNK